MIRAQRRRLAKEQILLAGGNASLALFLEAGGSSLYEQRFLALGVQRPSDLHYLRQDDLVELGMLLLTGRYDQQRVYTDAHAHFKAALKLRPKDDRVEIAMNNCADHIRKIMTQSAGGGTFGPDDED